MTRRSPKLNETFESESTHVFANISAKRQSTFETSSEAVERTNKGLGNLCESKFAFEATMRYGEGLSRKLQKMKSEQTDPNGAIQFLISFFPSEKRAGFRMKTVLKLSRKNVLCAFARALKKKNTTYEQTML